MVLQCVAQEIRGWSALLGASLVLFTGRFRPAILIHLIGHNADRHSRFRVELFDLLQRLHIHIRDRVGALARSALYAAKVPNHPLFRVAALLVANHRYRAPVIFRQTGDDRLVVSERAVAMAAHKIRKQVLHEIQQIRPLLMPRNLRSLPGPKMRVKLAPQFRHFLPYAFQFRVRLCCSGKPLQIFDVFSSRSISRCRCALGRA